MLSWYIHEFVGFLDVYASSADTYYTSATRAFETFIYIVVSRITISFCCSKLKDAWLKYSSM